MIEPPEKVVDDRALLPPRKEKRLNFSKSQCNDVFFAVLFLAHLAILCFTAFVFGRDIRWEDKDDGDVLFLIGAMICMGVIGGFGYVRCLKHCASCVIQTVLLIQPILCGFSAFAMFYLGSVFMGIIFTIATFLLFWYYFAVQNRIPFSVALIEIGTEIVTRFPGTMYLAILCVGIEVAFVTLWGTAIYGYYDSLTLNQDTQMKEPSFGIVIFFILSLYWSLEVCRFLLYCTVCGVTASWFFLPGHPDPTAYAFSRASTTSFGSICFGALVISVLRILESLLRSIRQNENDNACTVLLICMANLLLSCIEQMLEYMNQFGFVYVAVYGFSYMKACKQVYNLIVDTGFESIIQWDLTNSAMFAGSFLTGLITCVTTGYAARYHAGGEAQEHYGSIAALGFALGFGFSWLIMQTLIGAINTIFVVWASDPDTLFSNRPTEGMKLVESTKYVDKLNLKSTKHMSVIAPPPNEGNTV